MTKKILSCSMIISGILIIIFNVWILNNKPKYILRIFPHGIFEIFVLVFTLVTACYFSYSCLVIKKNVATKTRD